MHRKATDRWCTFMMPNLRQIMLMRMRVLVDNQMNISLEIQMPFVCHFISQSKWNRSIKKRRGLEERTNTNQPDMISVDSNSNFCLKT